MHVLVFRHIAIEQLGSGAPVLDAAAVSVDHVDLFREPGAHVDLRDAQGLIFLGGPMSVNDDLPYLRRELGFLEVVLAEGKPVLGICLGSQLIAKALGAPVYRNPVPEIGWAPVQRTDAGRIDPLFSSFRDPENVLHWHGETFDLPVGAIRLASSDVCPNQAFRYGANVYGIQFHVEATPDMIAQWSAAEVNAADVARLPAPIDPAAHAGRMRELSEAVFGAWAHMLAAAGAAHP